MMDKENVIEQLFLITPKNFNEKVLHYQNIIDEIKQHSCINYLDNNSTFLKNVLKECNALALEKALEMIFTYCEISDIGRRNLKSDSLTIAEKCFKQARLQTKTYGIDILVLLSEKHSSEITEMLLSQISSNKPNLVNGILETLIRMVKQVQTFPIKEVAKQIPNVIDSRDKSTRDLSKLLAIEICTYFGRNRIEPFLKDLKPILLNELQAEFDKVIPHNVANISEPLKPSVDLLAKMPPDFAEKIDGSRQERKDILDCILDIIDNSPLPNGNYRELVKKLCLIMTKDSQIQSVAVSVKILTQLATGLKKNFSNYAVQVIEACLEKFKEKKLIVLSATRECIDAAFMSLNFEGCSDQILKAIDNKNPTVRMETISFLIRIAKNNQGKTSLKKNIKHVMPLLRKTCDDMDQKVREQTFQLIGELISICGEKQINCFLDNVDPTKIQQIKSFVPPTGPDVPVAVHIPDSSKDAPKSDNVSNSSKLPPKPNCLTNPSKYQPKQDSADVKELATEVVRKAKNPVKMQKEVLISEQDLMEHYLQLLNKDVVDKISSQVWKNRLEACDKVLLYVEMHDIDRMSCQTITQLMLHKPGLRDSNAMVIRKKLQILQEIFKKCNNGLSVLIVQICLCEIVEKIGDVKLGVFAKETLSILFSKSSDSNHIFVQCLHHLVASKSIRSVTENLQWLIEYLSNFGSKSLPLKDVVPLIRQLLASTNSTVKHNTIILIGVFYKIHGKCVANYFESEKPALFGMISTEMNKIDKIMKEQKIKDQLAIKSVDVEIHREVDAIDKRCLNSNVVISDSIGSRESVTNETCDQSELSLEVKESVVGECEREVKDGCRSFVLDICEKLAHCTEQHPSSLFQEELGLFFSSIKGMCDPKMKSSINILLSALKTGWNETESVSTQTDANEISEPLPAKTPDYKGFVNTRRTRRANINFDKENVFVFKEISNNENSAEPKSKLEEEMKIVSIVREIIRVLENENSSYIIYENLSKLKRILKDESKNQIHIYVPDLLLALSKRASILTEVALPSSIQELMRIVAIVNNIYSEPIFARTVKEPVLSEIYKQLFLILSNSKFQSIEIFAELRKSISSLILDISSLSSTTEVLCSMLSLLSLSIHDMINNTVYIKVLIKSTLKILEKIETDKNIELDFYKVLILLNQSFNDFSNDEEKIDSMVFKTFKTIVNVLTKLKKSNLFEYLPQNNAQLTNYIHRCLIRINAR